MILIIINKYPSVKVILQGMCRALTNLKANIHGRSWRIANGFGDWRIAPAIDWLGFTRVQSKAQRRLAPPGCEPPCGVRTQWVTSGRTNNTHPAKRSSIGTRSPAVSRLKPDSGSGKLIAASSFRRLKKMADVLFAILWDLERSVCQALHPRRRSLWGPERLFLVLLLIFYFALIDRNTQADFMPKMECS